MSAEEAFSVMVPYSEKLKHMDQALLAAKEAEVIKANSKIQADLLQQTTQQLQDALQMIEELENQLEEQDTDFDTII